MSIMCRSDNEEQGRLKISEAPGLQHYGRPPYPRKLFLTIIYVKFRFVFLVYMPVNIHNTVLRKM